MTHLFLIHSHTTFLSSMGIISLRNMLDSSIGLLYFRNYKNKLMQKEYKSMDLSTFNYNFFKNILVYKRVISELDSKISQFVNGDEYIIYAPHLNNRLYQLIYTNSLCVGMNYIQEGALMFDKILTRTELPLLYKFYDYFLNVCFHGRLWSCHDSWAIPHRHLKKEPECFALSEDFFKALPYKQNTIKWPKFEIKDSDYKINNENPIFVFESSVEMGVIEKEVYMKYVDILIDNYSNKNNYIKFHPYQSADNKQYILNSFKKRQKNYELLSMDIPFEVYLSTYSHLVLCGFNSSLLVFGKQMGHEVISLEDKLLEESKRYSNFRNKL